MAAASESLGAGGVGFGAGSLPLDEFASRYSCLLAGGWAGEMGFEEAAERLVAERFTGMVCLSDGEGGELTMAVIDGVVFGAHLYTGVGEDVWGWGAVEALRGRRVSVQLVPMSVGELLELAGEV